MRLFFVVLVAGVLALGYAYEHRVTTCAPGTPSAPSTSFLWFYSAPSQPCR